MKKLLMVCEAFGGGVFTYVSQLCNDICDVYDVHLVYSIRPQTPSNYQDYIDPKVHMHQIENFGKLLDVRNDINVIRELRSMESEVKPDIIHLHSTIAGGFGRIAFRGKINSVVYTPHGYSFILMGSGFKSKIYWLLEKLLGRTNSMILTCCKSEDDISKTLSKSSFYIETGVNIADLEGVLDETDPIENKKFTVFTLGRACVQKQPYIFNRIAEKIPEADFIWIGNGELKNELTAKNIKITGWKSRKEALAIAKGANAFVLCSLGEAIAMSLIENMYMNKLCIVSDTVGNKSVISDGFNGYVCSTVDEYVEKIKRSMVSFPIELAEQAHRDVLNIYNTTKMKQKFIEFYDSL